MKGIEYLLLFTTIFLFMASLAFWVLDTLKHNKITNAIITLILAIISLIALILSLNNII